MTRNLIIASGMDTDAALEEIYEFEEWARDALPREHECLATVSSVKPRLVQSVYKSASARNPDQEHSRLLGYLLCFSDIYIGDTHLEDYSYAIIGRDFQKRLRFMPGDQVEFRSSFQILDGRIVFQQLKHIRFKTKTSGGETWNDSAALVARFTGQLLLNQADKCYACEAGLLIDVHIHEQGDAITCHRIFCLKGMPSASQCIYDRSKEIYGNTCHNRYNRKNGKP